MHNNSRTNAALNESTFLGTAGETLDQYIAQGQAVLGNLAVQRDVLKSEPACLVLAWRRF